MDAEKGSYEVESEKKKKKKKKIKKERKKEKKRVEVNRICDMVVSR